jgi:membrane protein involved in colicin uptake
MTTAAISWSMPQPVLKLVATLIAAGALGAFALGVATAPDKSRLPGERRGEASAGAPMEATDATPLGDERIQGTPPPRELTEEEKAKLEADKKAKEEAAAKAAAELLAPDPAAAAAPAPTPAQPAEKAPPTPQPEEPVF